MKKVLLMFVALAVVFAMVSCKQEPEKTYAIGDVGPGGGLVFYDCDADNDSGNADGLTSSDCGWRYLEAAPVASEATCQFGYFRESPTSANQAVGGTGTAIGTGKANTDKLVAAMGAEAYIASNGSEKTASYAAKHCADCNAGGKTDWFLPSKAELALIYTNLALNDLGSFDMGNSYISSSEKDQYSAYGHIFINGNPSDFSRNNTCKVRPVRQF